MAVWNENLANHPLEELLVSQSENRAWSKELRFGNSTLVASRLAKQISLEQYTTTRKQINEDMLECRRRAGILAEVIKNWR